MTEAKMLCIACFSTVAISLIAAWILFALAANPLVVVLGGTLTGMTGYGAVYLMSMRYLKQHAVELVTEEEHHA